MSTSVYRESGWVIVDGYGFIQDGSLDTFSIMTLDQHWNKTAAYWSYSCGWPKRLIPGLRENREDVQRVADILQNIADFAGFDFLQFKVEFVSYDDLNNPDHPYSLDKQWNYREHMGQFFNDPKLVHVDIKRGNVMKCRQFLKDIGAENRSKWMRYF